MAVLKAPVTAETVKVFRGVVDFYLWKGIPVARKWPRKKRNQPSEAELESRAAFAIWGKATGGVGSQVQRFHAEFVAGAEGYTWVDSFRAYASGAGWVSAD